MDWYPWFFQLYKADTMHLTPYQDGCYRRLIDHYMETRQPLPDNDYALARIVGDSHPNWVANGSAIVRPYFLAKNGLLYHKKCDEILNSQDAKTKNLSESGRKGAEKRWNKIKDIDRHPISHPNGHPIATPMGTAIAEERRGEEKKGEIRISPKEKNFIYHWPSTGELYNFQMLFDRLWTEYPSRRPKGGRKHARIKLQKILDRIEDYTALITGVLDYAEFCKQTETYNQHFITWLNQSGWETDWKSQITESKNHDKPQATATKTDRAKAALIRSHNTLVGGPGGKENHDKSGLSVLPVPETLREGT